MIEIIAAIALISSNLHIELDRRETLCLSTAIYHEARGEPVMGQVAVSYVVLNRVHNKRYPSNICGVVYQKHQFTDIKKAKPDFKSKEWKTAVEIATYTQVGLIKDYTAKSTMYYNPAKASPSWDFGKLALVGDLENHRFYRER